MFRHAILSDYRMACRLSRTLRLEAGSRSLVLAMAKDRYKRLAKDRYKRLAKDRYKRLAKDRYKRLVLGSTDNVSDQDMPMSVFLPLGEFLCHQLKGAMQTDIEFCEWRPATGHCKTYHIHVIEIIHACYEY